MYESIVAIHMAPLTQKTNIDVNLVYFKSLYLLLNFIFLFRRMFLLLLHVNKYFGSFYIIPTTVKITMGKDARMLWSKV